MKTALVIVPLTVSFALVAGCSAKSNFNGFADGGVPEAGSVKATDGGSGSRRDGGKPTTQAATPEAACELWVAAACDREEACSDLRFKMAWGDKSTCVARKKLGCVDRFAAPGSSQTPKDLSACAVAMAGASCEELALGKVPSECETSGTLAKGEGCAFDSQCESGYCRFGVGSDCGSCAERGKEFASCSSGDDCAPGLVCSGRSCRAPSKQGDYCGSSEPCVPWLTCSTDGTCEKGAPAGSSCGSGGPSDVYGCDAWNGVVCNSLLMACTAVRVQPSGAACDAFSDVCAAGAQCSGTFGGGYCEPAPREGDECSTLGSAPSCMWPSKCSLGKCALPDAAKCK